MSQQPGDSSDQGSDPTQGNEPSQPVFGQPDQSPNQPEQAPAAGPDQPAGDQSQAPRRSTDSASDPDATLLSPPPGAQQQDTSGQANPPAQASWGSPPAGSPGSGARPEETQQLGGPDTFGWGNQQPQQFGGQQGQQQYQGGPQYGDQQQYGGGQQAYGGPQQQQYAQQQQYDQQQQYGQQPYAGQQPAQQPYYPPQQAPQRRPSDANPIAATFDLSFSKYATPGLAKIVFFLAIAVGVFYWISSIIGGFTIGSIGAGIGGGSNPVLGILALIFGWIPVLFWIFVVRIGLEAAVANVRTATDVRLLREKLAEDDADSTDAG